MKNEVENTNNIQGNGVLPCVSGNANDVLILAREALMNAGGAYNTLRLLGAEQHLPGLSRCEDKRKEALEAIDRYLHCN